jgi:uncharacterized cupin superfamily protein
MICSALYFPLLLWCSFHFTQISTAFSFHKKELVAFHSSLRRADSATASKQLHIFIHRPILTGLQMSTSSSSTTTANTPKIQVISQPDQDFLEQKGVFDWDTWSCGVSKFPWTYSDGESCYLLAGKVTVTPLNDAEGAVTFSKGDFVTFPPGMSCTWDVQEAVKKHYTFF